MKFVIEDHDIDVDTLCDIYSRTIIDTDPSGFKFGRSYGSAIAGAVNEANAECKTNPRLILRITIETIEQTP